MMRFFFLFCIIISLTACNRASSDLFTLEGTIEGIEDSKNIILYYSIPKGDEFYEISDTAKIINGKFIFKGNIENVTAAELCFEGSFIAISVRIYLEPTTMKLRINRSQLYAYKLSGTKVEKENIELRKEMELDEKIYYEQTEHLNNIFKQIYLHGNNTPVPDSLIILLQYAKEHFNTIRHKMDSTRLDFILKHNTYQIVPDLLYLLAKQELISIDTIKYAYNNLPGHSKTSLMGRLALQQIEYLESEQDNSLESEQDNMEDGLIGNPAPDFTRKDFSGKTIRLSDFKNRNFVLLDFWASWCIPCIKEIPKMEDIYDEYHEKGLEIISISLDTDSAKWLKTIDKYKLDQWPQILSVLDDENLSTQYNVNGVPYLFLIDKRGKIIARWTYLGKEQLIEIDRIINETSIKKN